MPTRPLIVVEGANDVAKVKQLGFKYVIATGGFFVSRETISFLNSALAVRTVVILTDPDGPGQKIADFIKRRLPEVVVVNDLKASDGKRRGRVGIAYMPVEFLKKHLADYLELNAAEEAETVEKADLASLKLIGPESRMRRKKLADYYGFTSTSAQTVFDGLNILRVEVAAIREILDDE